MRVCVCVCIGGAEGAGETENVGRATPGRGARPRGGPLARLGAPGSPAAPGDRGEPGRWRWAGPLPCFRPHGRVLRSWQRVAAAPLPQPPALQGSKVKIKRITTQARLLRVRREDPLLSNYYGGPPRRVRSSRLPLAGDGKTDPQPSLRRSGGWLPLLKGR